MTSCRKARPRSFNARETARIVLEREDDPGRLAELVTRDQNMIQKLGILGIELNREIREMLPPLRRSAGVVVAARLDHHGLRLQAGRRDHTDAIRRDGLIAAISRLGIGEIFAGAGPFLLANVAILFAVCVFPALVLWIPGWWMG